MFPGPKELLAAREGTLAERPLPLLLLALMAEGRRCALELRSRQLEKRIEFEEGVPVGCTSNLLHETLGKFLVEKKKLTEEQYQQSLAESASTGTQMAQVLIQKSLIAPFDLFKQLQANLALKILDAFRWVDARYALSFDTEPVSNPIRMNGLQLILTGSLTTLPFDTLATHLMFSDEQRFALAAAPPHALEDLKLSARDLRFAQVFKARPTFAELQQKSGMDVEASMRRLFALGVLGFVEYATAHPVATPAPAPTPQAAPTVEPTPGPMRAAPSSVPYADEDEALTNALAEEVLQHRAKDPFDLLGVPESATVALIRKAFLERADRFSPTRFRSPEFKERAETLLAAYARAFGLLVEADSNAFHRKRREVARAAKPPGSPHAAEAQFRIRTDLLDASKQLAEGKAKLEAKAFRAAVDYFQYAFDIEPKALHRAYLAWARFLLNPQSHGKLALQELAEAVNAEPECEAAWAFKGAVHAALQQGTEAEECYRKAFKLNPNRRDYLDRARAAVAKKA